MTLSKYWKYYGENFCPDCKILIHRNDFEVILYDTTDHEGNPSKSKKKVCKKCKSDIERFRPFIFRSTSLMAYFLHFIGIAMVRLVNDLNSDMDFGEYCGTCGMIFLGIISLFGSFLMIKFSWSESKNDKLIVDEIASKT